MNGIVLTNRSAIDRNSTDFYETPTEVTNALFMFLEKNHLIERGSKIWEPASGGGKMAEVMRLRGYETIESDLYPVDNAMPSIDFLTAYEKCDWIITNPPFSKANEFIRHALELKKPCAFVLKSQFWHAKSRLQLFIDNPPNYVLPLTWRPDFLFGKKSGSPTMEILWSVWTYNNDKTVYYPLEKPQY